VRVFRFQLKSKLHRARVTDANVDYEGSITIPADLMRAADLWVGERVLVSSITNGARLETYVIQGNAGSGEIVVNGAAAHLIGKGHVVTIMAWAMHNLPVTPKRMLLDANNRVVSDAVR
jgi:aspartate 1-decarboxylase